MVPSDETLDLVNADDVVIGSKLRSEVYQEDLSNFRVINAFIKNSQGQLWIPRRTAHKKLFPSCLDVSVGGHVESGTTYDETFRKETMEELNIDINTVEHRLLGKLTPHRDHVSAFMQVYEISSDATPTYNPEDFTEYYWLTPQEFFEKFKQGEKVKGDLPQLIRAFYLNKN